MVFFAFESMLMRGRLFNLFKLFCVVVSRSLSFSFADLWPSLLSSFDGPRRLLSGDVRGLEPGSVRLVGRLMFKRDVGRGTIDELFSAGLSSFSSTCSVTSLDSVVDAAAAPLRLRLRRLNCGRGFSKRETVELSLSEDFSVVDVVG